MEYSFAMRLSLLALLLLAGYPRPYAVRAADALFWISTDDSSPGTPGVAEFTAANGMSRRLHVWAQPKTAMAGDWHTSTNPFLTLKNVSLDVVSTSSDFDFDTFVSDITVYNPGGDRFGDVSDSTSVIASDGSDPGPYDDLPTWPTDFTGGKGLLDLQGYSIPATAGDGFGVTCGSDSYCATTDAGSPAWLFASFTITPTADTGTVELWLQVGRNGMNHFDGSAVEAISLTNVVFGVNSVGSPPVYNADTDRQITELNDDSDAILYLARPGDYNADGTVDSLDYSLWKTDFGTSEYSADGNGDGVVDLADYTVWRNHLAAPGPVSSQRTSRVPECSTGVLLLIGVYWFLSNQAFQ